MRNMLIQIIETNNNKENKQQEIINQDDAQN